jgi:hypothetical protein
MSEVPASLELIKCSSCKCERFENEFKINRKGTRQKCCNVCIARLDSYKCEHRKPKGLCKVCSDYLLCEHGKKRCLCKDCKGVSICEHNKFKYSCKSCKALC